MPLLAATEPNLSQRNYGYALSDFASFAQQLSFLLQAPISEETSNSYLNMVGVTGLEPAASRPPAVRASQLRQSPITLNYKAKSIEPALKT